MNWKKGSQWRKWDLHFHTQTSYDYGDGSITNEQIIDGLVENEISVVAITDHHIMDVARIRALQQLGAVKGVTVLPGIEFLGGSSGRDPIHFIGIFSESCNLDYIWGQIEHNTNIKKIRGESKKHNEVYCELIAAADLIHNLGGIVTIHAGSKTNSLENITNALAHGIAQKEDIAKVIDIFEMGKEDDCAGYLQYVIPHLKNKIGKHIPMIICSDNHKITDYKLKQNLWIKANPTFEGLRQILFEPGDRVKIQSEKPDFKEDKLIIDEVRFMSDSKFTPEIIHFNENLNVIIGGKSSGKSILLYHIANTLIADKDFLKKAGVEDKYKFHSDDENFNFEIKTKGGFSQLMHRDDAENSVIPEIKYIPQNYLVKLAEPEQNKKGDALNIIVRDLINEDAESQMHYGDFISKVRLNDKKREAIIDSYFDIKDRITTLNTQLKQKSNPEILMKNIATNTEKVAAMNKSTGMTPEQIAAYNQLQERLEVNKSKRTNALSDFKKINEFNIELTATLNGLINKERLFRNSLENDVMKQEFTGVYKFLEEVLSTVTDFSQLFEVTKTEEGLNMISKDSAIKQIFTGLRDEKDQIEKQLQPFLQNVELKKQIELIQTSISEDNAALQAIAHLNKEVLDCQKALGEERKKLFTLYEENYSEYLNVISQLKVRTVDLEKDGLKISGLVKFNFNKFKKTVLGFSDGRRASYGKYEICKEEKTSLDDYQLTELLADLSAMFDSIVVDIDPYALVSRIEKKAAVKMLFEDNFFDYWQIEYKKDKLGEMSTGKASFVILMLIVGLSKSKAPILIDQPEDNLDNRSITTDLVEYLRNKKLDRQIILVTHNPNIVVNADAENIIIANQKGQNEVETESPYVFDYINGALEDSFAKITTEPDLLKSMGIREHIADIVEGGKEAFQKREVKYGFR